MRCALIPICEMKNDSWCSRGSNLLLTLLVYVTTCSTSYVTCTETAWQHQDGMAVAAGDIEIEDAPSSVKSEAWQCFGFVKSENNNGKKVNDKKKPVCKYCKRMLNFTNSTTNMMQHVSRCHSEKPRSAPPTPSVTPEGLLKGQSCWRASLQPCNETTTKTKEITRSIAVFLARY